MGEIMKKFKNNISLFLSFLLIFNLLYFSKEVSFVDATSQSANTQVIKKEDGKVVNPLYDGLNIKTYSQDNTMSSRSSVRVFKTKQEAANYLKEQMVKRSSQIKFIVKVKHYDNLYQDLFNMAVKDYDNGKSSEGDYLYRHWSNFNVQWDESKNDQTTFTYQMQYLSTYKQEMEVDYEVKKVLDELDVYDKDEYTKAKAVHDFITENIRYDYDLKKHSAYDAIITKKVVCNGYSSLTYKMMKELGLSVRCITGNKSTEYHSWNIAKIKDKWYNIDNTWDATYTANAFVSYNYFLKNNKEFSDHIRDKQFRTSSFNKSYPMSTTSYKTNDYYKKTFALNKLQKFMVVGERFGFYGINLSKNDKIKTYTSSNPKVATVSEKGVIDAISPGVVTITAVTENNKKATCRVRVRYDLSKSKVSNINNNVKIVYDGKSKKPSMKVTYKSTTLKEGKDYSVTYGENKKSGKGTITLYGMGNFTGIKSATFKIYPSKVTGEKVIKNTTSTLTLSWKKQDGVSGYRIYRATSSNGKYTYIGSTSSKVNTYTDKKLTRNKTYYYKIRAYKNLNNEKLYGDYSKVLKAKTK